MASATLIPPIVFGGVIGRQWHSFLEPSAKGYDGAILGALWATSAAIISHRSCQLQERIDEERIWFIRALSIGSFGLALISGSVIEHLLMNKYHFSIPDQITEKIGGAAILGSKVLVQFFSPHKLW